MSMLSYRFEISGDLVAMLHTGSLFSLAKVLRVNEAMKRLANLLEPEPEISADENLRRAFEISQIGLSMKFEQIVRENPDASPQERDGLYMEWLVHRSEAPWGDFPGRVRLP